MASEYEKRSITKKIFGKFVKYIFSIRSMRLCLCAYVLITDVWINSWVRGQTSIFRDRTGFTLPFSFTFFP